MSCELVSARRLPLTTFRRRPGCAETRRGHTVRSDVIVATLVRREFGGQLSSVYAPVILASFGSGQTRADIRETPLPGTVGLPVGAQAAPRFPQG